MLRSKEKSLWTLDYIENGFDTDAVATSGCSLQDSYDVVVIGSGFAGLVAARNILQDVSLIRVLLLEGRDRIGGRIWTSKVLDKEFEMGGTWVHWYAGLFRISIDLTHQSLYIGASQVSEQKLFVTTCTRTLRLLQRQQLWKRPCSRREVAIFENLIRHQPTRCWYLQQQNSAL